MYKTIVVGTDGSPSARRAVEVASELAKLMGAELHLVCGYKPASEIVGMSPAEVPMGALPDDGSVRDALTTEIEAQAEGARADGVRYEVHLAPGNGASAVLGVAEAKDADLIVVGNRGMSGVRRMLGSVPNNIAHHADASVLIVDTAG